MYEFEYDYEGKQRRKAIVLSAVIQFAVLFVLRDYRSTPKILCISLMAITIAGIFIERRTKKAFIVVQAVKMILWLIFLYIKFKAISRYMVFSDVKLSLLIVYLYAAIFPFMYYLINVHEYEHPKPVKSCYLEMEEDEYSRRLTKSLCSIAALQNVAFIMLHFMPFGTDTVNMIRLHFKYDYGLDYLYSGKLDRPVFYIFISLIILLEWISPKFFIVSERIKNILSILFSFFGVLMIVTSLSDYYYASKVAIYAFGFITLFLPYTIYSKKMRKLMIAKHYEKQDGSASGQIAQREKANIVQ